MEMTEELMKKETSCVTTNTLIRFAESRKLDINELLRDIPYPYSYLVDTHNWIAHTYTKKMYFRLAEMLNDPYATYQAAIFSKKLQTLGIVGKIGRLFTGPEIAYKRCKEISWKFNRIYNMEPVEVRQNHAIIKVQYLPSFEPTKLGCRYTEGILAVAPTHWLLPEADIKELQCQAEGAESCLYDIKFQEKRSFVKNFWYLTFGKAHRIQEALFELENNYDTIERQRDELLDLTTNLEKKVQERTAQYKSEKEKAEALNEQLKVAYSELEASSVKILKLTQELNAEKSIAMRGSQAHDILHQQKNHLALVANNLESTYRTVEKLNKTLESAVAALPEEQKAKLLQDIQVARSSYTRSLKVRPLIFEGMDRFILTYKALDRLAKDDGMQRNIKEDLESLIFVLTDNYAQYGIIFEKNIRQVATPNSYGPLANDIYINFIQNAFEELIKQKGEGQSNLRICVKATEIRDKLVVEIHDTGSGIREEDRERVFELFVSEKGRGTGLPTCRRIADKYGAKVYNTTSDIEGYTTKFVAEFPLETK